MYELKSAFILGICNLVVGSCTFSALLLIEENIDENLAQLIETLGIVCGSLFAELFFTKLSKHHAIPIILSVFCLSMPLMLTLTFYQNNITKALSLIGYLANMVAEILLFIVELGYLSKYIQTNPNTYSLAMLLSLNQLTWIFGPLIPTLPLWEYSIFYTGIIGICVVLTWGFEVEPRFFGSISEYRNTKVPFSVFTISFYAFGAIVAIYDIIAEYSFGKFSSKYLLWSLTFGYVIGSCLMSFLINLSRISLSFIILALSAISYTVILLFKYENSLDYVVGLIGFSMGMIENINIRLIIVNSLRPEFFIGLFYFLSYILHGVLVILYHTAFKEVVFYTAFTSGITLIGCFIMHAALINEKGNGK